MSEILLRKLIEPYALGFASLFVIFVLVTRFQNQKKLKALGERAPRIQSLAPFGLKFIYRAIYDNIYHRDLETWQNWFRPHGQACKTVATALLGMPVIMTEDHENVQAILATQFDDYGKGQRFHDEWKPFLGKSIFTTDGESWKASRKLIRPQFIKERVSDLSTFEDGLQKLFKSLDDLGDGTPVDINDWFYRFTLDTITEFLLGKSVESLHNPFNEFAKAMIEVQKIQNTIGKLGPMRAFVPTAAYNAGIANINDFINPFVQRALSQKQKVNDPDEKYTFLNALTEFTNDPEMLRDQIAAVLIAGRDTTAANLSWIFYELARHPEVVKKLRAEISREVGFSLPPTYENLKNMKYLTNVINETLRLYPGVPFNVRTALKDTTLPRGGGYDGRQPVAVLKDTLVVYSPLGMHRRPDYFTNPLQFNPDRWDGKPPTAWSYLPFNGGPRICIGQPFALAESGYTVTRMLQRYERVEDFMDSRARDEKLMGWNLKSEIVLQPTEGIKIGLWRS